MRFLASNWIFILFVGGMVWMHLAHGGHDGRHQTSPPAGRRGAACADHRRHAALAMVPAVTRTRGAATAETTAPGGTSSCDRRPTCGPDPARHPARH
jgi:hypothetical protein